MIAAFVALLAMSFIAPGFLIVGWHYDSKRHMQRMDQLEARIATVIASKNPDLELLIGLVDRQMQRIQAPEQAVIDHSIAQTPPSPPAVGFDDDDAFWKSRQLTPEELADQEMQAELAAQHGAA